MRTRGLVLILVILIGFILFLARPVEGYQEEYIKEREKESSILRDPIKIGALGPLTSSYGFGIDMKNAAELAVEEINVDGITVGTTTYDFELIVETTSGPTGQPDPSVATTSLDKLINTDQVTAIIGGFATDETIEIQRNLNTAPTPFLGVASSAPIISEYFWRVSPTNGTQLVKSILELYYYYLDAHLGVDNITIIREDAPWTLSIRNVLEGYLPLNANDMVFPTTATYTNVETALKALDTTGIDAFVTLFGQPVGKFVTQAWASLNMSQLLVGINVASQANTFFSETRGACYGEIILEGFPRDVASTSKSTAFKTAYEEKYGTDPELVSYVSYDAIYVLKDALERAGSLNVGDIQSALNDTDYLGTSYRIKFTSEPGSQLGINATGDPEPIPGAPTGITVHDLFTTAAVGTRGFPYTNWVFTQWQQNGVKKTIYGLASTPALENTSLLEWPIDHANHGYNDPLINLDAPVNGTMHQSGTTVDITIAGSNGTLVYNWDSSTNTSVIVGSSFNLTIPAGDGMHQLNLYTTNGFFWTGFSYTFTTDDTKPQITLISPSNNTVHKSGTSINLEFSDASNTAEIFYNWDNNQNSSTSTSPLETLLPAAEETHVLRVFATDEAGNWNSQLFEFITDDTSPTAVYANIAQLLSVKAVHSITVTPNDANGIDRVEFKLDDTLIHTANASPYKWEWDTTSTSNGDHFVTIRVIDLAGNVLEDVFTVKVANQGLIGGLDINTIFAALIAIGVPVSGFIYIKSFNFRHRKIINMYINQDMSIEAIARKTGKSKRKVEAILKKAKQM